MPVAINGGTKKTSNPFWGEVMGVPDRVSARSLPFDSPRGMAILRDPLLNKGTAFSEQERDALGLRGFLPAQVFSMEARIERVLTTLRNLSTYVAKDVALTEL